MKPSSTAKPPPKHRKRFVLIDTAMIDATLLYSDSAGKQRLGLILEITRDSKTGHFAVRQASPRKLIRRGIRGKILGSWKFLSSQWEKTEKPAKTNQRARRT